jgi:hypothetical protein
MAPGGADRQASTGFAKPGFTFVGRIVQAIPDSLVIPMRFAWARPDASVMKTATHRIDRAAFLSDPRKHLLHDAGFIIGEVKARVSPPSYLGTYR